MKTIDTKIALIIDEYNEKKEELKAIYDENYATVDSTPESILALNMWHTEEDNKLEKWFINELKKVFKGA